MGGAFLFRFHVTYIKALYQLFPELSWQLWLFPSIPSVFWRDKEQHRLYFNWLGSEKLNLRGLEDWYEVSFSQVLSIPPTHNLIFLNYQNSLSKCLEQIYPHHHWRLWLFSPSFLSRMLGEREQREYFEYIVQKRFNNSDLDNFYFLSLEHISNATFMQHLYDNCIFTALSTLYPHHEWSFWRWREQDVSPHHWHNVRNIRRYVDWICICMGFRTPFDFYTLDLVSLKRFSASKHILNRYENFFDVVSVSWPEFRFYEWLFSKNVTYKKLLERSGRFIHWLSNSLGFKSPNMWEIGNRQRTVHPKIITHALMENQIRVVWLLTVLPSPHIFWTRKEKQLEYISWISTNVHNFDDISFQNEEIELKSPVPNSRALFISSPRNQQIHTLYQNIHKRSYILWLSHDLQHETPSSYLRGISNLDLLITGANSLFHIYDLEKELVIQFPEFNATVLSNSLSVTILPPLHHLIYSTFIAS